MRFVSVGSQATHPIDATRRLCVVVASFVCTAVAADGSGLARSDRAGVDAELVTTVLMGTIAWAAVVGFGCALAALLLVSTARRIPTRGSVIGLLPCAVVASPFCVPLWMGTAEVLSGPGARHYAWIGKARVAAAVASVLGPIVLVRIHAAALLPHRPGLRRTLLVGWAFTIVACVVADAVVYPFLYQELHLMLWLLIAAGSLGVAATTLTGRRAATAMSGLAVLLAAWTFWQRPLDDSMAARAVAYRDTLFLCKALTWLAPAPEPEHVEADPELLARLAQSEHILPATLDRTFPGRRTFNVLLLGVDALRADRLGQSGYHRALTPNLDAFIAESTTFTRAWTVFPHTTYGMGALFQGRYASSTDVWKALPGTTLPPSQRRPTLQGTLGRHGWRTETVTGMTPSFFRHGPTLQVDFHAFDAGRGRGTLSHKAMDAKRLTALLLSTIDARDLAKPFFIWTHYFDAHAPYEPKDARFGDSDADRYDAEVAQADRHIGTLIEGLGARRLLERTVIILFADHGESFGEHGRPFHGTSLYEEQIHVPLAIRIPGLKHREVDTPVDTVDLAPTILDLLGIPHPEGLHGQSLLPFILGMSEATHPPPYAYAQLRDPRTHAVRGRRFKLIHDAVAQTYELFDLERDPGELRDVSSERVDDLERLKRVMASFRELR